MSYSYPNRPPKPVVVEVVEVKEHRCPNCYTPGFGKSSIRCKNEPVSERAQAFLDLRARLRADR